jgi:hypothetical protein
MKGARRFPERDGRAAADAVSGALRALPGPDGLAAWLDGEAECLSLGREDAVRFLTLHVLSAPFVDPWLEGQDWRVPDDCDAAVAEALRGFRPPPADALQPWYAARIAAMPPAGAGFDDRWTWFHETLAPVYESCSGPRERRMTCFTPPVLARFIVRSAAEAARREHGREIGGRDVPVLDPFCGPGVFLAAFLDSGLLDGDIRRKFTEGFHGYEMDPFLWRLARLSLEHAFRRRTEGRFGHVSCEGIRLTDTFRRAGGHEMAGAGGPA